MHRFFVDAKQLRQHQFKSQDKELCHQVSKVLKMRPGKQIVLCDDTETEHLAKWTTVSKSLCEAQILESHLVPDISQKRRVHFYVPPLKNQSRWELILEKGTELGVSSFTPLITERTEVPGLRKAERLRRIIKEAAEQSSRSKLPLLQEALDLSSLLSEIDTREQTGLILSLHEQQQRLSDIELKDDIHVLIGPVGDFTTSEVQQAIDHNFYSISLGKQVLRTETAAIATASLLLLN